MEKHHESLYQAIVHTRRGEGVLHCLASSSRDNEEPLASVEDDVEESSVDPSDLDKSPQEEEDDFKLVDRDETVVESTD